MCTVRKLNCGSNMCMSEFPLDRKVHSFSFSSASNNLTSHSSKPRALRSTHQVFGGAESLESVQGQEVSRVLVSELRGLLETPLLVQDGFVPDG